MTGISTALQAGLASATAFTKALFEDSWTAQQVVDFVNEQRNITIAATNQAGQHRAAVVIGGSVRDALVNDWLTTPNAHLEHARPIDYMHVQGTADVVEALRAEAAGAYA